MQVKFFINLDSHPSIVLRGREMATVGRSQRADYQIADPQLADIHFQLATDGSSCQVKNISSDGPPVLVNGIASPQMALRNGDIISAGNTSIRVALEESSKPESSVPTLGYTMADLGDGITRYSGELDEQSRQLLMDAWQGKHQLVVLANYQRAGKALPSDVNEDADLLKSAPDSIRSTDSIHLITPLDVADGKTNDQTDQYSQLWEQFLELSSHDAAILLITDKSTEELAQAMKMHVGWFSRPSTLQTFLTNGSSELRSNLIGPIQAAFLAVSHQWTMYVNNQQVQSWQDLGMPNPPN